MNKGHYDFIEIGTSDFDTLIETSNNNTVGLSIEPIKYYLDRLPNKNKVKKLQAAVSDIDGEIDIYYIHDDKIKEHSLPWWVRGSNSVGKPHPFTVKEIGKELYDSIVTIDKVPTLSWNTLVEQEQINSIGYLKIDTEGFDHIILNDYFNMCEKNPKLFADKIKFERHPEVSNIQKIDEIIVKFKNYYVEFNETDVVLTKVKIPRIIHQTFRTNELPEEIQEVVDKLKSMNPEFEYRFYNDEDCYNFIKENYDEETLTLYSNINPNYGSCRADFFRYLLMYKVGGVYLDIKSLTTAPLSKTILPTDEYLLTHWAGNDWAEELDYAHGEFQNWHIICVPNHPFLKDTIERVKNNLKSYNGDKGKKSVLFLTGPIPYSKSILSHLKNHKTIYVDSPVREFKLENEINLTYRATSQHQVKIYGPNSSNDEPIMLNYKKHKKSYVLYANESYFDIVKTCAKSIREFSDLPIFIYLLNSDLKVNIPNTTTINWKCELTESPNEMYSNEGENFYINRGNKIIYNLLIQRPLITKHVLENYSETVVYVDSDSVATPYIDNIFDLYDSSLNYPYFVEGVYDWMHYNGRGGADSREDLSTTLEHEACELFGVDQYVRQRYRQTGYYVAGKNCIDFLDEWYWMCTNPKITKNFVKYAPYHEETIMNVLLWKYNIMDGLPYLYVNGGSEVVDRMYTEVEFKGPGIDNHIDSWLRAPENKETIMFFHGEKRIDKMEEMIGKIKSYTTIKKEKNQNLKVLFLAPHLSTGGMPGFLLKRIETLLEYCPEIEIFVVEYSNYSPTFIVQRNRIKELLPSSNFFELGENKFELINIIKDNNIDVVHVDEMLEGFDSFNQVSPQLMNELYDNNRTWRMVETCHNVWFDPGSAKKFHPDAYAFCTPYHKEKTFVGMPSYGQVLEFPIDNNFRTKQQQLEAQKELRLDPSKTHVVNVGLWTSGKNQKEGVELARLLEESNPEIQFHFVGNQAPNFKSYWEPIMESLPSNVKVWGERSDVSTFMKAADVFMFNSTWECNPLVLREAASYGLKILSRNLPQYMNMFTPYITPIDDDLNVIKEKLLDLILQERTYEVLPGQSKKFALDHKMLYELVADTEPKPQSKINPNVTINQHFVNQPFIEIKGEGDSKFEVKVFDEDGVNQYHNTIGVNHWVRLNREYYTKWNTKIWENGSLIYDNTLNYEGKRVFITFDSSSLGDTVAWLPYCLEFQKKHKCHVIVSTFKNFLFKDVYPELEFVDRGSTVHNLYGMYHIGWFYNTNKEPELPNTIPLQKTITNILGLEYEEIQPRISYEIGERPCEEKYVTIATNSTSGCKFWTKEGWQELIDYLYSMDYKIINVSKEKNPFNHVTQIEDTSMESTMNVIHHSEFFIGLSSGLSWLAWGMGKHVVMISNFTEPDHEFTTNCTRIVNLDVCNGCWNNPIYKFDKGDWNWCPVHKGTNRQFECHKSITSDMVIKQIQHLL